MFEVAELGHAVAKAEYKARVPELRTRLLTLQQRLLEADFPVLVLVSGVDGAGKGATVNLLNEWLDPRHLRTYAFGPKSDEERERPDFWRFWRALPPHGHIG
ncbi:MAG TPA: polyphosphate:AMP phosphotransferase, partial [Gammaproteobacteria bacterium]|nr:polyphosphate:AMP phosphotransferase [Gammaproteobacteria bacterium]